MHRDDPTLDSWAPKLSGTKNQLEIVFSYKKSESKGELGFKPSLKPTIERPMPN